jgi:hypothetical protein
MVRLASIDHKGKQKLAAQTPDGSSYVDLSNIAPHSRAFFEGGQTALGKAQELLSSGPTIPASEARLLTPLDPSTVQKFLCIGMNYVSQKIVVSLVGLEAVVPLEGL